MLQGAFSSLFFSESLSHSSVSIFLFSLFCSCLSVQKRYQTKRSPSLTREKSTTLNGRSKWTLKNFQHLKGNIYRPTYISLNRIFAKPTLTTIAIFVIRAYILG